MTTDSDVVVEALVIEGLVTAISGESSDAGVEAS